MSDTTAAPETAAPEAEPVTLEDLQRMLDDANNRVAAVQEERDRFRNRAATLEGELEGERTLRSTAEQDHAARAKTDAERRWDLEKQAVQNGIRAHQSALEAAKVAYREAAAEGDWDKAADAQANMAEATANLTNFRGRETYLDTNKEALIAPPAPRAVPQSPVSSADPYAQHIKGGIMAAEREWLDARPRFLTDPAYREQVFAASNFAAQVAPRGTPAYIAEINRIMGEGSEAPRQPAAPEPEPRPRQAAASQPRLSADIPPQRRAGPGQEPSAGPVRVKLTADQAEVADSIFGNPNQPQMYIADQGQRYQHYADMLQRSRDNGRLN